VGLSNGSAFEATQGWNANSFCEQNGDICKVGDVNKDNRTTSSGSVDPPAMSLLPFRPALAFRCPVHG
jgi:hypothetical protein